MDRKHVGHATGSGVTDFGATHKQAIVTLVEGKSGFAVLAKGSIESSDLVGLAIEAKLKPLNSRVKTLTVDRGKEFADHQAIDQRPSIQTYFVDSYCSCQRDIKSSFNGLRGQYIPKAQHLGNNNDDDFKIIENN